MPHSLKACWAVLSSAVILIIFSVLSNTMATVLNGGEMPVDISSFENLDKSSALRRLDASLSHKVMNQETKVRWLCDIYPVYKYGEVVQIRSIGDFLRDISGIMLLASGILLIIFFAQVFRGQILIHSE